MPKIKIDFRKMKPGKPTARQLEFLKELGYDTSKITTFDEAHDIISREVVNLREMYRKALEEYYDWLWKNLGIPYEPLNM